MKYDIQLTPHFRLSEFLRSSTATARKIDNTPSLDVVSNLQQLCVNVLEPLRTYANTPEGKSSSSLSLSSSLAIPIAISSGFRSKALNAAVGGSSTSQHMTGEACDIRIPDEETGRRWFEWLMDNVPFHQLIWEKSTPTSTRHWIHVAFRQDGHNAQHVIQNLVKNP